MTTEGQLFSVQYIPHGTALGANDRFRLRLATAYELNFPPSSRSAVADAIQLRLGVQVPFGYGGYLYAEFFQEAELRDVLDAITIIFDVLTARYGDDAAALWRSYVERTFSTENLPYRMDRKGGVHRAIDAEHDRNRACSLASLQAPRYAAVAALLEKGFLELEATRGDALSALKDCFSAAELMAQLLCGSDDPLDRVFAEKRLRPVVERAYAADVATAAIPSALVTGLGNWAEVLGGLGEARKKRIPPAVLPDELALLLISQGASFIRWLAQLDHQLAHDGR